MPKRDKYNKCPCCGYAVEQQIGSPSGRCYLAPVQQAVFNAVKKAPDGISGEALYDRVWGNRVARSYNIVGSTVKLANQKLAKWGLRIKGHGGPGSVYRLLKIEAQPDA